MEDVGLLDFLGDVLGRLVRGDEREGIGDAAGAEALDGAQVIEPRVLLIHKTKVFPFFWRCAVKCVILQADSITVTEG